MPTWLSLRASQVRAGLEGHMGGARRKCLQDFRRRVPAGWALGLGHRSSHLSWRVRFLKERWSSEQITHRAALMVESSAFQNVAPFEPEKVQPFAGAQIQVESSGGITDHREDLPWRTITAPSSRPSSKHSKSQTSQRTPTSPATMLFFQQG